MGPILAPIIYLALVIASFAYTATKHGQPKDGEHNIVSSMIGMAICLSLFYWGGFFDQLLTRLAP